MVAQALFGSARWFQVGLIFIQPSEIAKIVIILILADFFSRNQHRIHEIRWIFYSFFTAMGIIVWVILQPNLSTSIVMFVLWLSMLFIAGVRLKHVLLLGLAGYRHGILVPLLIQIGCHQALPDRARYKFSFS